MVACIALLTGLAAYLINRMHESDDNDLSKLLKNPIRDRSTDP